MRILYVEDNPVDASVTAAALMLAHTVSAVDIAYTLAEAMRRLPLLDSYDLVLLDLELPDGIGLAFLEALRQLDRRLPIVILSGSPAAGAAESALACGADHYIEKQQFYLLDLPEQLAQLGRSGRYLDHSQRPRSSAQQLHLEARREQILERRLDRLSHLLQASPTTLYNLKRTREGWLPTWVSDNVLEILGHPRSAVLRTDWWLNHVHPDDRARAAQVFDALADQDRYVHQYRMLLPDGTAKLIHDQLRVSRNAAGEAVEIIGAWNDITHLREPRALARSRLAPDSLGGLAERLRSALARHELAVWYQPKIDIATHRIIGVEALARWTDPELGVVPPDKFIPAAEAHGLVDELGRTVFGIACRDMMRWRAASRDELRLAVNLSPLELERPGLAERIGAALAEAGLPPSALELEITEGALMKDPDQVSRQLAALKALGVHLALDDFGKGYSSLGYLSAFPIDILKIDKQFVDGLPSRPSDMAITAAIVQLGKALGQQVLAEGVERAEQLEVLRSLGCHSYQGYLYSRPLPSEAMTDLLAKETGHLRGRSAP